MYEGVDADCERECEEGDTQDCFFIKFVGEKAQDKKLRYDYEGTDDCEECSYICGGEFELCDEKDS